MDFALNDEQRAFVAAARAFSQKELAPKAAQWDEQGHFPVDVIKKAGEQGYLSLYVPVAWGGMGLGRLDACLILEELCHGCTSTAAYMTIHNMASWMLATFGSDALRHAWCPALASGELLASYCLTEPNAGSDAASLRTTARKEGDSYRLNGSKMFISGAGATDVLVLMARTGGEGAKGISCFLVPANTPGVSYGRKEQKMGWNSQPTRAVVLDDVRIPAANLIGGEGEGFKIAMKGLDGGRINIATCSLGTAQAALEQAQAYLHSRQQFGRAIGEFQALQFKFADMVTELVAARHLVHLAAWKLDQQDPDATTYSAMAKRFATDAGFFVCNEALQIHGGYGYIREYPLERHLRDSRVHQILEGTNEIMRLIIARRMLLEGALELVR